jgi:hypothetical protein
MTSLDRTKSISHLSLEELGDEIKDEVMWCFRLWSYICMLFSLDFCFKAQKRE